MTNYILNKLPKDIVRIINSYLYNYIPKEVDIRVTKAKDISHFKNVNMGGGLLFVGNINSHKITLISKRCRMCNKCYLKGKPGDVDNINSLDDIKNFIDNDLAPLMTNRQKRDLKRYGNKPHHVWYRKAGGVNVLNGCYDVSICKKLVLSQDLSTYWTQAFDQTCRYSIINGVVYHCVEDENKFRLVPVFKSDHCWQDMGLMFSSCENAKEKTSKKYDLESEYGIDRGVDRDMIRKQNSKSNCSIF